jgi:hypothetical protein
MRDKFWNHNYESKSMWQSRDWHHTYSRKKKFKCAPSAGKTTTRFEG